MSDKAYAERLARAIESLKCAEVIRSTFGENVVTVVFRVTTKYPDGKIDERPLLAALERLVLHDPTGTKSQWLSHVCSRLLPKQMEDGQWRMVKGWNITINSTNMGEHLDVVSRLLRGESDTTPVTKELTEFPLVGVGPSRNPPNERKRKGLGAYTIGGKDDIKVGR